MLSTSCAVIVATILAGALAAPAAAQTFRADLKGSEEVPPVTTSATGTLTATYDPASKRLSWQGNVLGLSGNAIAAHFHGPAEKGKNAGVLVPAPGVSSGNFQGSATLTDDQARALLAGQTYFNVHTQKNPSGEIRGQVTRAQ